jgi:hypothetical protein
MTFDPAYSTMVANSADPTFLKLLQLGALIQSSITTYLEHRNAKHDSLPSRPCFEAQRTLLAASGLLTELVIPPSNRILEVATQYFEARALHLVAGERIPDLLANSGEDGLELSKIATASGIEPRKMGESYCMPWTKRRHGT